MQASAAEVPNAESLATNNKESNLTELQLLYWIGHQLRSSAVHFNNAFSFAFTTPICPQLFQQAFATAVCQYDALRTVILEQDGIPQQHVLDKLPAPLGFVDLSAEADPEAAAVAWQQQQVQRPFQLNRCLYDSVLLKLNNHQFTWFLNEHHLITDASSFFLIAETVLREYEGLQREEPLAGTEKPTFARYAASLLKQQNSSRAEKSRLFWQEKLSQKPEPLHFYGRSPLKISEQVQRWTYNLGPDQTTQLIALAESIDLGTATSELRQFCLTATLFFSLLHQLTGNTQLGFVTTIHNRATQVNRQTVGALMELCPVLVAIEPEETFVSLMQKVAAEMKQLLLHYRHGASKSASDLALDVMFTFVQRPSLMLAGQTVAHEIVHPGCGSEQLGLHVHHLADSNSYELYLDFHQDSFTAAEQEHAKQSMQQLIVALIQNPESFITATATAWPQGAVSLADGANEGGYGRTRPAYLPPSTLMEIQLQKIWEEILEQSPIGVNDDFFALGGESWRAMNFLSKFEAATGHYLPLGILLKHSTIASLAQQIAIATQPETVIQIQPGTAGILPLFLIPGAAGNTLAMDRVVQHMSPTLPVYTFQMPMLHHNDVPPANVGVLATCYLEAIQTVQPHGPYYLGGYSAGGIVAYEVAQKLRVLGEKVEFLVIIDMPAPNLNYQLWHRLSHRLAMLGHLSPEREEKLYLLGRDYLNRLSFFVVLGRKPWLRTFKLRIQRFWRLSLTQKFDHLRRFFRRRSAEGSASNNRNNNRPVLRDMDPSSLSDPRARTLFDVYDRAARKYVPQPYDGRLTLLRCPLGYGRKEIRSPYPHFGWLRLVRHLEVHTINAHGHLVLLQEPAVTIVGQTIQTALSQAINKEES